MVEIEMRQHDVPHVSRREAEPLHLPHRRQRAGRTGSGSRWMNSGLSARIGPLHVLHAEAGIDERQPLVVSTSRQWQTRPRPARG